MWHAYLTSKWRRHSKCSKSGAQIRSSGWRLKIWSHQDIEYSKSSLGVNLRRGPRREHKALQYLEAGWRGISKGNWERIASELRGEGRDNWVLEAKLRKCSKKENSGWIDAVDRSAETGALMFNTSQVCTIRNAQSNISQPHLLKWNKLSFPTGSLYRHLQDSLGGPCLSSTRSETHRQNKDSEAPLELDSQPQALTLVFQGPSRTIFQEPWRQSSPSSSQRGGVSFSWVILWAKQSGFLGLCREILLSVLAVSLSLSLSLSHTYTQRLFLLRFTSAPETRKKPRRLHSEQSLPTSLSILQFVWPASCPPA